MAQRSVCQTSVDLSLAHTSLVRRIKQLHVQLEPKQDHSWWSAMQIHSLLMQMRSRAAEQDVQPGAMSDFKTRFQTVKQTRRVRACVCVCDWQPPVKSSLLYLLFSVLSAALHYELLLPTCLWHSLKATWTFFHECSVIIDLWNATVCIQPKVTMLMIKSQRSFLISGRFQLSLTTESKTFSLPLYPSSPNHSWTLIPYLFFLHFVIYYYLLI